MPRRSSKVNEVIALTASCSNDEGLFLSGLTSNDFGVLVKSCKTEVEVLELARRVLTEAGAKYFGVPIGSLITPDKEDDAKAQHQGRPAPPNSVTGSNQKRAGTRENKSSEPYVKPAQSSTQTKATPEASKINASPVVNWGAVPFGKSSLSGSVKVVTGNVEHNVPEGSIVYRSPTHPGRAYVITPDGNAHVFTSRGELQIDPQIAASLARQIETQLTAEEKTEEESEQVTWVRLVSIARQLAQAEEIGDESTVKRLEEEFRQALSVYDVEADPRQVRSEIVKNK